jgi:hypothetical protein
MKIDGALIGGDWTRSGEEAAVLEMQGFAGAWSFEGQRPSHPIGPTAGEWKSMG